MASLRNGGDRPAVRRGVSPAPSGTAPRVRPSSASSSRPSSTASSPDKDRPAVTKNIPNYLRPTISSQAPDAAGTHSKAKTGTAQGKRLTRIKSMEKPQAHHHPHPHPQPTRSASYAGVRSSATAVKSSNAASSSSARGAAGSSTRPVTDKNRRASPKPVVKSSAPAATKARATAGPAAGKKKEAAASASSSPTTAVVAHHQDSADEALEVPKDEVELKVITITTDPASPTAAHEEHHGELQQDPLDLEEEEQSHPAEEEHLPPEVEESHNPVPEPEEEIQPVSTHSPPHDVTDHEEGSPKTQPKHGEDDSPLAVEEHPAGDHISISSPPATAETNKYLSRSRTVPARPKPSDAAKIPVDDELQRKLMSRKAWETGGGADVVTPNKGTAEESSSPALKRQDTLGKKESPAYNDVIEETASKLNEKRKNKVLALAGAFETVISLQEPKTPQSGQNTPSAAETAASDSVIKGEEAPHDSEAKEDVPTESADVVAESNAGEIHKENGDESDAAVATAKE